MIFSAVPLFVAALVACRSAPIAPPPATVVAEHTAVPLSADAVTRDLSIFEQAMIELHPGLARYQTVDAFRESCAAVRGKFAGGATRRALFEELTRLSASIRCGHTFPNPANTAEELRAELFGTQRCLPVAFRCFDGRVVAMRGVGDASSIPRGAEIIAVDGRPVAELLSRLVPLVRADGGNDAKRYALLETESPDPVLTFDTLLPFVAPPHDGGWSVTLRDRPEDPERTLFLRAVPSSERMPPNPPELEKDAPLWSKREVAPGVLLVAMPTWVVYKTKWDWKAWLDRAIDEAIERGDRAIVFDLRGNEGGSSVGDEIIARLVATRTALPTFERKVRYRSVPDALTPYLTTWDPSFRSWGSAASDEVDADGLRRLVREGESADGDVIEPRGRRFEGKVVVLVGPENSSATFEFALAVKRLGLGTLVGRPTGGNCRGINGGAFFFLTLPESHIEIDVPLIGFYPKEGAASQPDAGVEPDVAVSDTPTDVASGRDAPLQAALAIVGVR